MSLKLPSSYIIKGQILNRSDLYSIFERYGKIRQITLQENNQATIQYEDSMGALLAQKHLNGFKIIDFDIEI